MTEDRRHTTKPSVARPAATQRKSTPTSALLRLQRLVGNRAIAQALTVQRDVKLGDGPSQAVGNVQQQLNATGAAPRVVITGRFDTATETAVKAFQKANKLTESGVVDAATTKALDLAKPVITAGGQQTVDTQTADATGKLAGQSGHPDLVIGAKGPAVKELQQRLNGSTTVAAAKSKLSVDGIFGPLTEGILKQFQKDQAVAPADGAAKGITWGKLETAGAATSGRVEYEWREEVEGVKNVGGRAGYQWSLNASKLLISAKIKFVAAPGTKMAQVSGRVSQWVAEIPEIWNSFRAVDRKNPANKTDINFEIKQEGGDSVVKVHKDAKRSDAANWHTGDTRRGLAAHEFGHLIGLADEYNRDEGQYRAVTGQEAGVGTVTGDAAKTSQLAKDIKAKMPIADAKGQALRAEVQTATGGTQGGYARLIAKDYNTLFGSAIQTDISAAFDAKGITGFTNERAFAMEPFLNSNASIMGTMGEAAKKPAKGHDHSVEPRHVAPFVNIIIRERTRPGAPAQQWEAERR
jgi:peptidoglycan hydrolase-like protein with peptidoglycan-binding domain